MERASSIADQICLAAQACIGEAIGVTAIVSPATAYGRHAPSSTWAAAHRASRIGGNAVMLSSGIAKISSRRGLRHIIVASFKRQPRVADQSRKCMGAIFSACRRAEEAKAESEMKMAANGASKACPTTEKLCTLMLGAKYLTEKSAVLQWPKARERQP